MKILKLIFFIILGLTFLTIIFFYPKSSGRGGVCTGCEIKLCKCLGFENVLVLDGPWKKTCYGIPHSCRRYNR